MSLIRDIEDWWAERHGRRRDREAAIKRKLIAQTERELAAAIAEEAIVRALHDQAKTFLFADRLIKARKEVARLTKLMEQLKA